jgi:F0F1-type ATP synthase alpha subunit
VGTIASVSTGVAKVSGLPGVGYEELLEFPCGVFGIAFNVDEIEIGAVLLGDYWRLRAGDEVQRTGRVMDVGVGDGLLGRVIDARSASYQTRVPTGQAPVAFLRRPRCITIKPHTEKQSAWRCFEYLQTKSLRKRC